MDKSTQHYYAEVTIGAGGSWATSADKDEAVKRCIRIAYADWKTMYDIKGKPVMVRLTLMTKQADGEWSEERLPLVEARFPE